MEQKYNKKDQRDDLTTALFVEMADLKILVSEIPQAYLEDLFTSNFRTFCTDLNILLEGTA